ncbi:SDR family oxidoreductase [Desulfovibrio caledoniensis]
MDTTARTAIVTGGSRGIGKAISLRLARDGFAVALNYIGNKEEADRTVADIKGAGGHALAVQGDVGKPEDMERLFDRAGETFGSVDVVVNSAGIMPMLPIQEADMDVFDKVIAVNLRGAFIVLGLAAKRLERGGRIIALSSSVIAPAFPGYGPYIASKAGVEGLIRVLANEMRGHGITVNAIAPGPIGTDLFLKGKTEEQIARIGAMAPLEPRLGTPEEIAAAVAFLAGPDGTWVHGQVLRVNGGFA